MDNYRDRPIIVMGVNHAGTRVLVDMLSCLGSDAGDNENRWRESETFIRVHYLLLGCENKSEWNRMLFDLDLYRSDSFSYDEQKTRQFLDAEVPIHFPNRDKAPWHWKCPTSALFLDFWIKQYPDAYFLHIVRNKYDIAYSLMSRKQFRSLRNALEFYDLFEDKLASMRRHPVKYLKVDYHHLENELVKIIDFLPFLKGNIDDATGLIRRKKKWFGWKRHLTVKTNLWNNYNILRLFFARRIKI